VHITPEEIAKTMRETPPLHRASIANRYQGLAVQWDLVLAHANMEGRDKVWLHLRTPNRMSWNSVTCTVALSDYPVLKVLTDGAPIRVIGEIQDVDAVSSTVKLDHVKLIVPPPPIAEAEQRSAS
jgi:hypothetical protein